MLPEFVADRDLGKRVPETLRVHGWRLVTLPEIYGEDAAQHAEDTSWIAEAGKRDRLAITKNKRIRYVNTELAALAEHRVALFAIANGNLSIAEMAGAFLFAQARIFAIAAEHPGSSLWIVHRDGDVKPAWP